MQHIEVFVIGGGPIGLSCGIGLQKRNIPYIIADKGCLVNSIHNFPNDMTFFSSSDKLEIGNVPFSSTTLRPGKEEVQEYYRRVAQHFDLKLHLYESFESIQPSNSKDARFIVTTSKAQYLCNFLINAAGFYDTPIFLDVEGENLPKVKHYFTSAHHLFKQKVAIIGAANSAIDVALEAYRKGADVSLIVRGKGISDRVKYWIKPNVEARIKEGSIKAFYDAKVLKVTENHILIKQNNKERLLENDFVFAMTGYRPNFELLKSLNVSIDPKSGIPDYDTESMESNVKGIYLAGVVCGGLNTREWFIENARVHGEIISNHISQHYGITE